VAGELTRVARTAPATLTHTFVVGEHATDVTSGSVTLATTDPSGVAVPAASGTATTAGAGTGTYTFLMPGQPQLTRLATAWTGTFSGSAVTEVDYLEIVGGFFFDLARARGSDDSITDMSRYSTLMLATRRQEVEDECEMICDRAFVPRYRRAILDGSGTPDLLLTDDAWAKQGRSAADIRTIRSASIAPQIGQPFVPLTTLQLAAVTVTADNMLRRVDGTIWTEGVQNIIVEYEYGLDAPSSELVDGSLLRLRSRLQSRAAGIPDRASSFTATDGGTYRLDMPGPFKTGLPFVDAVYSRYSRRSGSGTGTGRSVVAARTLTYTPQTNSLFHTKL
jgi:hypothetical protein